MTPGCVHEFAKQICTRFPGLGIRRNTESALEDAGRKRGRRSNIGDVSRIKLLPIQENLNRTREFWQGRAGDFAVVTRRIQHYR